MEIFKACDYDLVHVSAFELIKTYIFDFTHNNEKKLIKLKMMKHMENLENVSIFMAKLMLHDEEYYEYK